MIRSKEAVEAFLKDFMPKFNIWGIFFINRDKNTEALRALGIRPADREDIVRKIKTEDYVETIEDLKTFGEMWVFGKDYDETELYIKISIGQPSDRTICISFHIAERLLSYPYKQ